MNDTSIQIDREHFSSVDGLQLFYQANLCRKPKANILLAHGFGEHCGRYDELTAQLNDQNYNVFRFDLRGHGRSDGKRGHIFAFEEYLQDFACFKQRALSDSRAVQRTALLAHSYGGLIAFSAMLRDKSDVEFLALSSPFFGMADGIPRWKIGLGKVLSRYLPALSLPTEIDSKDISHDPQTIHEYETDTLMGRTASTRWLTETLAAQENCHAQAESMQLPILIQQAGDDRLASRNASRAVFDKVSSQDKQWTEYDGMYHEIWFELEREQPLGELYTWLNEHFDN